MKYNEKLGHVEQVDMEEDVAAVIFDKVDAYSGKELSEDLCAQLGRDILLMVLEKFRPDVFVQTCSWCDKPATTQGTDGTFSCGQGQGDNLDPHDNIKVLYVPLARPMETPRRDTSKFVNCPDCGRKIRT